MHRLKSLEKEIKAHEYCPDQIGYYFCCEFVDMTLDDLEPLKELLVKHKIIGPDNSLETVKAEEPQEDFTAIADEWHFTDEVKAEFKSIIDDADAYYIVNINGPDARSLSDWSSIRVLQKGEQFAELEFYICD